MIAFADVILGSGDGVRCTRCADVAVGAEPSYRSAEEMLAEAAAICSAWTRGAGPNIRLTGAEPFGHPELPRIVSGIVAAGCRRLALDSDAIGLRSETNARGSLAAGARHLRSTMLAGTEGVHDALAGVPGMLDATREGIRSYRSAATAEGLDVSVTVRIPVCRHNVQDLPSAVGVALDCGADRVEIRITDGGLDLCAAIPWITAACDTGVVNGVWVEVEGVPFCLVRGYDLHLADAVRTRDGSKQPVCGECALDPVCAGAPVGASADQLAVLEPPVFASDLAPKVARARAGEVR